MSDRKSGIYWVRRKLFDRSKGGKWELGSYNFGLWHFIYDTNEYQDEDIFEFGESVEKKR